MILQRDPRLRPEIQEWGCYYMCLLWWANKLTNIALDTRIINHLFVTFDRHGWLLSDCFVQDPTAILQYLGVDAEYTDKHEPPTRQCGPHEFEIIKWVLPRTGSAHFAAGNGRGTVTYDPWGISQAVTSGRLDSKRIFRLTGG
jgi:hypothetical protein